MSKTMTKCFAAFAVVAFVVASIAFFAPSQAFAYGYQVRVFGGNDWGDGTTTSPGDFGQIATAEVSYGEPYNLPFAEANKKLSKYGEKSKYYVKGFRIAGHDELCNTSYTITEDTDFVVAYGVKGNMVDYTVRYVESGSGNALTGSDSGKTSVTYQGNVGDKPVVPYEFIRGYRPVYRNITKTLVDDPSQNVFEFEYVPLAAGETESGATTGTTAATPTTTTPSVTTTAPSTTATTPSTTGTGTTGTGTDTGNDNATGTTPATPTTPTAPTTTPATPVEPPATQELLDEDNPLASAIDTEGGDTSATPTEGTEGGKGIPTAAIFAIAAVLVALVGALIYLFRRRNGAAELADAAAEGEASSNGPGDTTN